VNDRCPHCKAQLLKGEPEENGFHEDCYRRWISALFDELRGRRVISAAA